MSENNTLLHENILEDIQKETIHKIKNMDDFLKAITEELEDVMYIHVPEKKDIGKCYRVDFCLKQKKEIFQIAKEKKIRLPKDFKQYDFFVYNEKTQEVLPFKKNDYLINSHGYFTYDGTYYIQFDNEGNEIGRFSFTSS